MASPASVQRCQACHGCSTSAGSRQPSWPAPSARLASRAARAPRATRCRARSESTDQPDRLINYENLELAVPKLQRPINELDQVKGDALYKWAMAGNRGFASRLAAVYALVFAFIGGPISFQTFDPSDQLPLFVLSSSVGALLVTTVITLRIYLGWSYVGERLLSATIEYEETGWYDGQIFVKPPEVLARDRLVGTYEVNPIMKRLRASLLLSGGGLVLAGVLLVGAVRASSDTNGMYGRGAARAPVQSSNAGLVYSKTVRDISELRENDEAAAAEQAAQNGVPGYCGDRYYQAFAGAEKLCAKFNQRQAPPP